MDICFCKKEKKLQNISVFIFDAFLVTLITNYWILVLGPTDLSMKKGLSSPSNAVKHSLNPSEVIAVKQLIAGYRESAAFLLRSADELEQLLLQQNWTKPNPAFTRQWWPSHGPLRGISSFETSVVVFCGRGEGISKIKEYFSSRSLKNIFETDLPWALLSW